jgi:hypothetical protein
MAAIGAAARQKVKRRLAMASVANAMNRGNPACAVLNAPALPEPVIARPYDLIEKGCFSRPGI